MKQQNDTFKQLQERFRLKITAFNQGQCFICGEPCKEGFYSHSECAIAYEDYKAKLIRDFLSSPESDLVRKKVREELLKVKNSLILDRMNNK